MTTSSGQSLPAYLRIAAELRDQIASGELAKGAQLPTEHELAERFGVARQTARNSLVQLVAEGLVVAHRPFGHFVRKHEHMTYAPQRESKPSMSTKMDRFRQQVAEEGRTGSQTIEVSLVPAPMLVAERLQVPAGEQVVARRRLRFINGEPVNTNDSYYPLDVVKDSEIMSPADIPRGTNQVLTDRGYAQVRAIDQFECRMPTPEEANRLGLGKTGTPVMIHVVTGYDATERPVRCTVNVLPGDRHIIIYERTWE